MREVTKLRLRPALLALTSEQAFGAGTVDAARIEAAASDPANWLTTFRTLSEERFNPLTQITDKTRKGRDGETP